MWGPGTERRAEVHFFGRRTGRADDGVLEHGAHWIFHGWGILGDDQWLWVYQVRVSVCLFCVDGWDTAVHCTCSMSTLGWKRICAKLRQRGIWAVRKWCCVILECIKSTLMYILVSIGLVVVGCHAYSKRRIHSCWTYTQPPGISRLDRQHSTTHEMYIYRSAYSNTDSPTVSAEKKITSSIIL